MNFEWDPEKDRINRKQHGVSFDEAKELFSGDDDYLEIYDVEHSYDEDRFIGIGPIQSGLVLIVYTERSEGRFESSARDGRPSRRLACFGSTWG